MVLRSGPPVVVLRDAAQQHLSVDGAGAAHHFTAGRWQHIGLLRRTLGPPSPVVGSALGRGVRLVAVLRVVRIILVVGIVRAGFKQQHRAVCVLGQPGCHHTTAGAGPDHDNVVFHCYASFAGMRIFVIVGVKITPVWPSINRRGSQNSLRPPATSVGTLTRHQAPGSVAGWVVGVYPMPLRSKRPGKAPVGSPSSKVISPLTMVQR